jgi:DNA-binding transcriptional MerR regulator
LVEKGPNAFRTISEAAAEVGAPPHVLRFWETRFSFVRPVRRGGGQRFYRPRDIELLIAVRQRLHEDGLSIREVQRLSRSALLARSDQPADGVDGSLERLRVVLSAAVAAKSRLDALLGR